MNKQIFAGEFHFHKEVRGRYMLIQKGVRARSWNISWNSRVRVSQRSSTSLHCHQLSPFLCQAQNIPVEGNYPCFSTLQDYIYCQVDWWGLCLLFLWLWRECQNKVYFSPSMIAQNLSSLKKCMEVFKDNISLFLNNDHIINKHYDFHRLLYLCFITVARGRYY